VDAAHVYWAEWSATPITQNLVTEYTGTITIIRPNGQTVVVTVTFTSTAGVDFVQDGSGIDYWKSGSANSPYTSSTVDNDPPAASVVAFSKKTNVTVEFSQALGNIYFAYNSINGNIYTFYNNFAILSNGKGYWGSGTVVKNVVGSTYQLQATGGDPAGTIGFNGTFSTFNFNVGVDENWNGFTIGTYGLDVDVNPPTPCVDYLSIIPNPTPGGCCPIPTLYCVKLLNAVPQTPQSVTTCTQQNEGSASFILSQSGQKVVLSADVKGTTSPAFDELGILTVTAPSGTVRGSNYISWQNDCQDTAYPAVSVPHQPATPAVDISSLFGNEVGTFSINIKEWNKYTPYSNSDVYVCTGSSLSSSVDQLTEVVTMDAITASGSQASNGLSTSMTILISVLSAVGTSILIVGLTMFAGYSLIKSGQIGSGLSQQLQ